jgi:predicted RNase H-like HicB family nuclease
MPTYKIKIFYSDEDEGYIAIAPDIPGCSAFGETEDEARKEMMTAMDLWLKTAMEQGRPVPHEQSQATNIAY